MTDRIYGTYQNGQVLLDEEVDWVDGERIEVRLIQAATENAALGENGDVRPRFIEMLNDPNRFGIDESFWPLSVAERELLVRHMDEMGSLQTSEQADQLEEVLRESKREQTEIMQHNWDEIGRIFK